LLEHGEDFVLYAMLDFVIENYQPMGEAIHAKSMNWNATSCVAH
jgi:magnesium transporter